MIYEPSYLAIGVFAFFVASVLGISFYLGAKAKSAAGYYAAHGGIPWFVNGIAFAGDYLSAASFLGICGLVAFYGYDGFLYSIGYLAGWVVALFVIAEPIKRLGKFTFADAMDARFNSRGIKLAVAISTLVVSVFYLIPQMVGSGALIRPLLGMKDISLGGLPVNWLTAVSSAHSSEKRSRLGRHCWGGTSEFHAPGREISSRPRSTMRRSRSLNLNSERVHSVQSTEATGSPAAIDATQSRKR